MRKLIFFMLKLIKYPLEDETCMKIAIIDECVKDMNFSLDGSEDDEKEDVKLESEKEKSTFSQNLNFL